MIIEFTQTKDDIISFIQYHNLHSEERKNTRRLVRIIWGLFFSTPILVYIFITDSRNVTSFPGALLVGCLLFFVGYSYATSAQPSYYKKGAVKLISDKRNEGLLGWRVIEFKDDEVIYTSSLSKEYHKKEVLKKVIEDSNHFYLYHNSYAAFIIPKNVFNKEQTIQDFRTLINNFCQHW